MSLIYNFTNIDLWLSYTILKIYQFFFTSRFAFMTPMEKKSSSHIDVQWNSVCLAICSPGDLHLASDSHGDMCCDHDPPTEKKSYSSFVCRRSVLLLFPCEKIWLIFPAKFWIEKFKWYWHRFVIIVYFQCKFESNLTKNCL